MLLRYNRPPNASSSAYPLDVSADLVNWTSGDALILSATITPLNASLETVTLRVNLLKPNPAQFFRIKQTAF